MTIRRSLCFLPERLSVSMEDNVEKGAGVFQRNMERDRKSIGRETVPEIV